MNRRDLIRKVVSGGTVLIMVPTVLQSCSKDDEPTPGGGTPPPAGSKITIDLSAAENAALNTAGGSKIVQTVLVANTGNSAFIALTSICTHDGCTVGYDSVSNNIKCPCHGSSFTTSGSVITGPASSSLKAYPVSKSGDILTISL